MVIPIASDHAGYEAKEHIKKVLEKLGHEPLDVGTHSPDSVDYPDYAVPVSRAVSEGEHGRGILVCGSGQGMCMTANKFRNVRAAMVWSEESAEMSRRHNDANIMCLPGRSMDEAALEEAVRIWLQTEFEGGRHNRRITKIDELTQNPVKPNS